MIKSTLLPMPLGHAGMWDLSGPTCPESSSMLSSLARAVRIASHRNVVGILCAPPESQQRKQRANSFPEKTGVHLVCRGQTRPKLPATSQSKSNKDYTEQLKPDRPTPTVSLRPMGSLRPMRSLQPMDGIAPAAPYGGRRDPLNRHKSWCRGKPRWSIWGRAVSGGSL